MKTQTSDRYDRRLKNWFRAYNRAYFENSLPDPKILRYTELKDAAGVTHYEEGGINRVPQEILIHSALRYFPRISQTILLHEMAHVSINCVGGCHVFHGMRWQAEILRLFMAGAYEELL